MAFGSHLSTEYLSALSLSVFSLSLSLKSRIIGIYRAFARNLSQPARALLLSGQLAREEERKSLVTSRVATASNRVQGECIVRETVRRRPSLSQLLGIRSLSRRDYVYFSSFPLSPSLSRQRAAKPVNSK